MNLLKNTVAALLFVLFTFVTAASVQAEPLAVTDVVASADDGNVAENTLDGNLATRWSAQGDGQHITYELEMCDTVSAVQIAWYQGNTRTSTFDIQVSDDGTTFTPVHSGTSAGNTTALETVNIPDTHACFVRIVGHGNSHTNPFTALWNSITEVVVEGPAPGVVDVPLSLLQELCAPLLAQ